MKFNFTVVNSSSSNIKAESNVSYVAPQDFVGEGRISRFRLSSTTFPLAFIQASSKTYSSFQKDAITKEGITPTDICFGFYIPYCDTSQMKYTDIQQSAFIAPTNGIGSWYQGVTQESGAQSGTITYPQHTLSGGVAIPTLSTFDQEFIPMGGDASLGNRASIELKEIAYGQAVKQLYLGQEPTTLTINMGTSISERMIKYMGAILNTKEMVNTPLDQHGGGGSNAFDVLGGYIFVTYYYLNETPVWEEVEGGFKLKNKGKFIHSWDFKNELGAERSFAYNYKRRGYTSASAYTDITPVYFAKDPSINFVHVNDTTFDVRLDCPVNFIDTYGVTGTPVLITSIYASYFLNCDTNPDLFFADFPANTQIPFPDLEIPEDEAEEETYKRLWFKIPLCESKLVNPQAELVDYHAGLDFSSTFTIHAPASITNPVTCLILTSPSLSFKGESISVDTKQLQGVISPSSLPILRTFYVGVDSNKERSDLVFVDDMLTSYPIIFNSPRIVNVKLSLFALTKTNDLVLMEIPPNGDMAIQISIV